MKKLLAGVATLFTIGLYAQWDTLNTGVNYTFNAAHFFNRDTGLVCGYTTLYQASNYYGAAGVRTVDGGNTWQEVNFNSPAFFPQVNDMDFASSGIGFAACSWGYILRSDDFGTTYNSNLIFGSSSQVRVNFLSVCAAGDSVFYLGGEMGTLLRTEDLGITWDTLTIGSTENINDIYFADAANGWIVADGGYMAATSDSGNTWTFVAQSLWGFYDINSFAYQDSMGLNPYIVGESGNAQFSVNGGVNWYSYSTGTTEDINKIRFMNTVSGIMCGNNGYIYRSEDYGTTWFSDPSPESVDFFDIAFAGDTTAFICGDSGVVLRSRMDVSSVHHPSVASIGVNVYPNPTSGPLFVSVLLKSESNVEVQLVDLTGQVLQANYYENVSAGENRFEVGTGECAQGIYFLRVISGESVVTLPVIKQ